MTALHGAAIMADKGDTMQPLLPERRDQLDFFVCDIFDAVPKDDLGSMEHPMFALSTRPDTAIRHYEHNGNSVTITPSVLGLATIFDKDILIYCISQLVEAMNQGRPISRTVRVTCMVKKLKYFVHKAFCDLAFPLPTAYLPQRCHSSYGSVSKVEMD